MIAADDFPLHFAVFIMVLGILKWFRLVGVAQKLAKLTETGPSAINNYLVL